MRLVAPQVTNGINAKRRIQNKKRSPDSGEQETSQPPDPAVVQQSHHEGEREAGKDNGDIITMLPHHYRVLFEFSGIFIVFIGIYPEQPATMTMPKSSLSIVGIFFLVAPGMMADMV